MEDCESIGSDGSEEEEGIDRENEEKKEGLYTITSTSRTSDTIYENTSKNKSYFETSPMALIDSTDTTTTTNKHDNYSYKTTHKSDSTSTHTATNNSLSRVKKKKRRVLFSKSQTVELEKRLEYI